MRPPAVRVGVPALAGAALLAFPAQVYRVDSLISSCGWFPDWPTRVGCAIAYLAAVGLLTFAWREAQRASLTVRQVFLLGLAVHAVAMIGLPFLSSDPLFYVAIGRGGPHALAGDPLLSYLPPDWRQGTSPYFFGFEALARALAHLPLTAALRGYQLTGLFCMLATAALVACACDDEGARARAAAAVLLSPLAVIEATSNGHNDALLAVTVGAFALATMRGRPWLALASLWAGLVVKATAALILAVESGRRLLRPARGLLTPRRVILAGFAFMLAAVAGFLALERRWPAVGSFTALVGHPDDTWEHCTRSLECLPRAFLRYIVHRNQAAWRVGLVFRGLGGLWLLWAAARAAAEAASPTAILRWTATALFVYYLLLHGFMESWYLLSLLPLLAFADPVQQPAMRLFTVTAVSYYPFDFLLGCQRDPLLVGIREVGEALLTVIVPTAYLLWSVARARQSRVTA